MASLIDFSKPVYGTPTTQSVRDNFQIAQHEISALQDLTDSAPFLSLSGGTMAGQLTLFRNPVANFEAATKEYVDEIAFGGGNSIPDAPKDGMFYARGGSTGGTIANDWTANPLFTGLRIGSNNTTILFGLSSDATYNFYDLLTGGANRFRFNRSSGLLELVINGNVISGYSDSVINFNRNLNVAGTLNVPLGALATPSLTWGTANTGIWGTATQMNVSIAGAQRFSVSSSLAAFGTAVALSSAGSAGAAILHFGTFNTGIYGAAASIAATISGTAKLTLAAANMTMTVPVVLPADPINPLESATKQYVDNKQPLGGPYLPLAGGTLTGGLSLGSTAAPGNTPNNLSRHITVYSPGYGFTVTSNRFNIVSAGGASHFHVVGGTDVAWFGSDGLHLSPGAFVTNNADPTAAMHSATKQYADTKLPLAGGTLTGTLYANYGLAVQGGDFSIGWNGAGGAFAILNTAAGYYKAFRFQSNGINRWDVATINSEPNDGTNVGADLVFNAFNDTANTTLAAMRISRATGLATVYGDPTAQLGIATKQYVDTKAGQYLPLTGGVVTGGTRFNIGLNIGTPAGPQTVISVDGASTVGSGFSFYSGGSQRWMFAMDHYPEAGGATGNDGVGIALFSFNNDGSYHNQPLGIDRNTGIIVANQSTFRASRDPTASLEMATKQYVDGKVGGSGYLPLTGGTITGVLSISVADQVLGFLYRGATKGIRIVTQSNGSYIEGVDNTGSGSYEPLFLGGSYVYLSSPTAVINNSSFTLAKDPTSIMEAVTKQYSDRNKTRGLADVTSINVTLTVDQADYSYIYIYGSPTGPSTITMPVATTVRVVWIMNNTTSQPCTIKGVSGGTFTIPSGGSVGLWTDTGGIYTLYNAGLTQPAGNSSLLWATTQFVDLSFLKKSGGIVTGQTGFVGINFGANMADGSNLMTKHIDLYQGWGGFNVTSGALNVIAGGTVCLVFSDSGMALPSGKYFDMAAGANPYWSGIPTAGNHLVNKTYVDGAFLKLSGGTMIGTLTLSADPVAALEASTRRYTDTKLPLAGGTLTNFLTLNAAPTATLHAATKGYVDGKLALTGGTITGNLNVTGTIAATNNIVSQATAPTYPNVTCKSPGVYNAGMYLNTDAAYLSIGSFNDVNVQVANWLLCFYSGGSPFFQCVIGNAYKSGGGPWGDLSDSRIKTVTGDYKLGLNEILNLNPIRFKFKGNDSFGKLMESSHKDTRTEYVGFVAQDLQKVMPETVTKMSGYIDDKPVDDLLSVDLTSLPLALVNAIKELHARVVMLETKLATGET